LNPGGIRRGRHEGVRKSIELVKSRNEWKEKWGRGERERRRDESGKKRDESSWV